MEEKIYKSLNTGVSNIYPGNLKGLPDDCFSLNNTDSYDEGTIVLIDAGFYWFVNSILQLNEKVYNNYKLLYGNLRLT